MNFKKTTIQKSGDFCGPRSQKTFRFLQPCLSMCLGIFGVLWHIFGLDYVVGEDWNPYIFEAAISVRPGDCCVSDCLSRDDDIYIYMMICNSWAVGPQLLGSEFIHLQPSFLVVQLQRLSAALALPLAVID